MDSEKNNVVSDGMTEYIRDLAESQPYFKGLLEAVRHGETEVSLIRQEVNKHIQLEWIEAIELCLVSLDNAIRRPARYIEERDEVKPIELSRSIRARSLIHLAQHTDYISEVKGDTVTPNRILNIYNEETLFTYENRFLNTLVHRLFTFVNKRYMEMVKKGMENGSALSMESSFQDGNYKGTVSVKINVAESLNAEDVQDSNLKRAAQLNSVISSFLKTEFIQSMGDAFIRPPVMRTNALLKNKNLNTCLELWQFIESYDKVGYTVYIEQKAESPNKELINKLYDDLALQYAAFKHDICEVPDTPAVIDEEESESEPIVNAQFDTIDDRKFDLYDSEYRKLAPVPYGLRPHKITDQVYDIRAAVAAAINADSQMTTDRLEKYHTVQQTREKLLLLKKKDQERIRREEEALRRKERAALYAQEMGELSQGSVYSFGRLKKSFKAKLIQASDETKEYYRRIKNILMSYKNIHSRVSWNYENFNIGRNNVARFTVRGKSLWLYLQLEPEQFAQTKYKVVAQSGTRYQSIPCGYKINNARRSKYAADLIAQMCTELGIKAGEPKEIEYLLPYQDTQKLIEIGLIKKTVARGPQFENSIAVPTESEQKLPEQEKNSADSTDTRDVEPDKSGSENISEQTEFFAEPKSEEKTRSNEPTNESAESERNSDELELKPSEESETIVKSDENAFEQSVLNDESSPNQSEETVENPNAEQFEKESESNFTDEKQTTEDSEQKQDGGKRSFFSKLFDKNRKK